MYTSLIQALGIINCTIVKRHGNNNFELLYGTNDWAYALLPHARDDTHFTIDDHSPYLQDFLIDAEHFWQIGNDGQIQSGIWSEKTASSLLRLEAIAAVTKGECFLVINNLEQQYARQQKTLQSARELLITNDKMLAEQEYLQERLETILRQADNLTALQAPLNKVIEHAEFGIIIADADMQIVQQNPRALALFELSEQQAPPSPLSITMRLFNEQCPSVERILSTHSEWRGELFWHMSEYVNKWLDLSLQAVVDAQGALVNWIFILNDVTRLKYLQQRNEQLGMYDIVTDLPNRHLLLQNTESAVSDQHPFYFLYLDIKWFKRVNDRYGHAVGDTLLIELVERIQPLLGDENLLARMGGDEFAILLHDTTSAKECDAFCQRLIQTVEQPFYTPDKQQLRVGLNIGVAHYPSDATDCEQLVRFADMAVYSAKRQLDSHAAFYSKSLKDITMKRIAMEEALRKAIKAREFELFLQPIIDMRSGGIVKAEALIRWRDKSNKLISPDEFIPIAELCGLIIPIGHWVIEQAGNMLKLLHSYNDQLTLSVNLSPKQLNDEHLLDAFTATINKTGIDASKVELEITEGVLIDNFERVERHIRQLRKLGIRISIDDFGTGYSSLRYLQRLSVDTVKIDRSFVHDLSDNENDKAIVLAVIAIAKSLGLEVIAEGVETKAQRHFLMDNACFIAQGYLFGRPVPVDDFCQLLSCE
ncbi:putative bifunctional diguanylate cyclase/phosphodiesterase [Alteromonas halophila]|uniref:EAL domain-containing protein n=1 Tax=Alteromonas halophila TaxID=516698 RepID=A0A918JIC9_9ALTE|nr:GGDEF domain-containing phosphodiesterase [Alteromonas halophila]GGW81587.1 hypothetical protein GCM10007391_13500 [Alteromonas halophila]